VASAKVRFINALNNNNNTYSLWEDAVSDWPKSVQLNRKCMCVFVVHRTQKDWRRCGSATCFQTCLRKHCSTCSHSESLRLLLTWPPWFNTVGWAAGGGECWHWSADRGSDVPSVGSQSVVEEDDEVEWVICPLTGRTASHWKKNYASHRLRVREATTSPAWN